MGTLLRSNWITGAAVRTACRSGAGMSGHLSRLPAKLVMGIEDGAARSSGAYCRRRLDLFALMGRNFVRVSPRLSPAPFWSPCGPQRTVQVPTAHRMPIGQIQGAEKNALVCANWVRRASACSSLATGSRIVRCTIWTDLQPHTRVKPRLPSTPVDFPQPASQKACAPARQQLGLP